MDGVTWFGSLKSFFRRSGELEAEPATEATSALKFPAQFSGCPDDGNFLALENSGNNEGGSGFSVFFQARQEMKKKGIIKIGDNQICLWERSAKSVLDLK